MKNKKNKNLLKNCYLDMTINQPVELEIVIVLAERIDKHLGDFQPANIKTKLKR